MILLSSNSQLLVQPRLLFSFLSASFPPSGFKFVLITTLQTWNSAPWGAGDLTVQTLSVILLSFPPFHPPTSTVCLSVSLCLTFYPLLFLLWRWDLSDGGFLLKLVLVSSHVHLCDNSLCFHKYKKNTVQKYMGEKQGVREEEKMKTKSLCDWVWCMCMCVCWFLPWVCGRFCQGNNCESRWTVKIHSRICFISYVILICPLVK